MRILGIDPGTKLCGFAIIDCAEHGNPALVMAGAIKLQAQQNIHTRLANLAVEIAALIEQYHPVEMAIEDQYVGANPRGCLKLAGAKEVVIIVAKQHDMEVQEYSPTMVKKAVTGHGGADKGFVSLCVCQSLGVQQESIKYYDTTDAIAVAICHAHRVPVRKLIEVEIPVRRR